MRLRWAWLLLCAASCKGDYLGAAVSAGAAVGAAGVYRTATDGCWADCADGDLCDEQSGMCVPAPCGAPCPADYRCRWVDGRQQCVLPQQEAGHHVAPVATPRQTDKETNHALCLVAGLIDCPDRPHMPLGTGGAAPAEGGGSPARSSTGPGGAGPAPPTQYHPQDATRTTPPGRQGR